MRRSTIAVFLLVVPPSSALACDGEHKAGWFDVMPARSWELLEAGGEGNPREEMSSLWAIAAGTASLGLIAVSFRAYSRARDKDLMRALEPAALPLTVLPIDGTLRVDPGHEPGEPTRVIPESVGILSVVAAGAE